MVDIVRLETDFLRLDVAPSLGGAALRFEAKRGPGPDVEAIFRPTALPDIVAVGFEPNDSSFYPLVPWVSRLCPPVLPTANGSLAIPPNRPGEAFPIHGWGAYVPWRVLFDTATAVSLGLEHAGPPPFSAQIDYRLSSTTLDVALSVVNRLDRAVGVGLGFHPWLPRREGGKLHAPAQCVWLSGADKIPFAAERPPADWDFSAERMLPERDLDHGFGGWTGQATYTWPAQEGRWRLDISSDCGDYIVYAPAGRPYFCFEPVSHKPSPGQTGALDGLVMLNPGQALRRRASFIVAAPGKPAFAGGVSAALGHGICA